MSWETLDDAIFQLKKQIEVAQSYGIRGATMGQRIEDDIKRLCNSGWLNLAEMMSDHDRHKEELDSLTPTPDSEMCMSLKRPC